MAVTQGCPGLSPQEMLGIWQGRGAGTPVLGASGYEIEGML